PTLSVSAAAGIENGLVPLDIAAGLSGIVGELTVTVTGLPEGASLSAGIQQSDGAWLLSSEQLVGLTLTPAPNSGEDFALTITATLDDPLTHTHSSVTATLPVTIVDTVIEPIVE